MQKKAPTGLDALHCKKNLRVIIPRSPPSGILGPLQKTHIRWCRRRLCPLPWKTRIDIYKTPIIVCKGAKNPQNLTSSNIEGWMWKNCPLTVPWWSRGHRLLNRLRNRLLNRHLNRYLYRFLDRLLNRLLNSTSCKDSWIALGASSMTA